jgi:hypothetical protein
MRAGVAQGELVSPVLFSLYVNDIPVPYRHVELAQYADDTVLVATSRSPSLIVGYLEAYLGRLERWLGDWRTAINVSKSTAVLVSHCVCEEPWLESRAHISSKIFCWRNHAGAYPCLWST